MAEMNPQNSSTVIGYFPSEQKAEAALDALRSAGFSHHQVGLAGHEESAISVKKPEPGFWHRTRTLFGGGDNPAATRTAVSQPISTGMMGGPETASHFDYNREDFHRTLTGLSLPEDRSRYFSHLLGREREGVLVTVNAGTRSSEAESILKQAGADLGQEISTWSPGERTEVPPGNERIQLYGEVLRVHRDRVQSGEVRLRKETVTENKSLNVPVAHDELVLERTPVTEERPAPGAEIGNEAEVRIPLTEERVSIEKEPVVREEVRAGKKEVTNVESRDEEVRREELKVEDEKRREDERHRRVA